MHEITRLNGKQFLEIHQKLVNKETMSPVDFDTIEPGSLGPECRSGKIVSSFGTSPPALANDEGATGCIPISVGVVFLPQWYI